MSAECLRSAQKLMQEKLYRRSVSSAHYAAYCAITAELAAQGVSFARGWNNPAHEQLPALIINLTGLPHSAKYQLRKAIIALRGQREDADYRPYVTVEKPAALEALRTLQEITVVLEGRHRGT